jgi:hypothetical protein
MSPDYDGATHIEYKGFAVDIPELEKYLTRKHGYSGSGTTAIVGCEIVSSPINECDKQVFIAVLNEDFLQIKRQAGQLNMSAEEFINKILHNYLGDGE